MINITRSDDCGTPRKRSRGLDGSSRDTTAGNHRNIVGGAGTGRRSKVVTGSGTVTGENRKMKTAPADIFVYGVHKSTEIQDIVDDLAYSDIIVQPEDVVKKTREPSSLDCYRISVKASDLTKALHPDVWPLKVRVRE